MKKNISNLAKDRFLISALIACILMISAAALISDFYKKSGGPENEDYIGMNDDKETKDSQNIDETMETVKAPETTAPKINEHTPAKIDISAETKSLPTVETEETLDVGRGEGQAILVQNETEPPTDVIVTEPVPETPEETLPIAEVPETEAPYVQPEPEVNVNAPVYELTFDGTGRLAWPVEGEIIRDFSMDTTVWYSTLKEFKVSNAIQIQSQAGALVRACANGEVKVVGYNNEIGNFVIMDIGNGYTLEYAFLDDINVAPGDYVKQGFAFATVSEPTYYYTLDGDNLYLSMTKDGLYIDPLDFLE